MARSALRFRNAYKGYITREQTKTPNPSRFARHLLQPEKAFKIEMTLDRIFTHTIKGHFCSLLVSNIFLNPHFLLSTFQTANPNNTHIFHFFSTSSQAYIHAILKGEFYLTS